MQGFFSTEFKELIGRARDVAAELRYDFISTYHFLLADCLSNEGAYGIRSFLFADADAFKRYYEAVKAIQGYKRPEYHDPGTIPILKETEAALTEARFEVYKYNHPQVISAHFFLAAIRDAGSELNRAISPKEDLYDRLHVYYRECGLIEPKSDPPGEPPVAGRQRKLNIIAVNNPEHPLTPPLRIFWLMNTGVLPPDTSLQTEGDQKTEFVIEQLGTSKKDDIQEYGLLLGEKYGHRKVMIPVSPFAAQALAVELEKYATERPLSHRLCYNMIYGLGFQVREGLIHACENNEFYTSVSLVNEDRRLVQDMAVTDAIVLCIMSNAPVYITEKVAKKVAFLVADETEQ
jgi:bifunctional DNase/RNase